MAKFSFYFFGGLNRLKAQLASKTMPKVPTTKYANTFNSFMDLGSR